ncbi:MAG: lipid A deacylase LpxR family protein [Bacteroidota bacterium]
MFLPKTLAAAVVFSPLIIFAQKDIPVATDFYQNEMSLVTENDNYTLQKRDGYYTNGFYLKLSRAVDLNKKKRLKNKTGIKKIINGFQLGQAIYNPVSYNRPFPESQDRPFAGYLALTYSQNIFYKDNSVLEWALRLGTIGPNSAAKNVQRWYHRVIGIYDVKGWPYQVNNEVSLNLKVAYYRSLLKSPPQFNRLNLDGFAVANLGNAFTNLAIGTTVKIGLVENHWNSSHWRARVSTATGSRPAYKRELYLFYEPAVTFQAYSGVLQGGMFLKDKGPVVADIKTLVISQQVGLRFAQNRFTGALVYTNRTRQATIQQRNENFGSIQIGYRFGRTK